MTDNLPLRCCSRVRIKGMTNRWRSCRRQASLPDIDGQVYCNQHHPDNMAEAARLRKAEATLHFDDKRKARRLEVAAPALLQALELMLSDYRTEGCPDPSCGICKGSAAASKAAYDAIKLALGTSDGNG